MKELVYERFGFVSSFDNPDNTELADLHENMMRFYKERAKPQDYYRQAEAGNRNWEDGHHPFHQKVLDVLCPGEVVAEFGCGTGYASNFFLKRGVRYAGFDLSPESISAKCIDQLGCVLFAANAYAAPIRSMSVDAAVSFYSIEHVVWPAKYLDEMVRVTKPGGIVALAFPDYLSNVRRRIASIQFGEESGGVKEKLRKGHIMDAVKGYFQRQSYDRCLANVRNQIYVHKNFVFLIFTRPRCLRMAYSSDNDAVYFASEEEICLYLKKLGCAVEVRSRNLKSRTGENLDAALSGNGLVIARKG